MPPPVLHSLREFLHRRRNEIIRVALALPLILMVAMAWAFIAEDRALHESLSWIEQSYQVRAELNRVRSLWAEIETAQRGYLLNHDAEARQTVAASRAQIAEAFGHLGGLATDDSRMKAEIDRVQQLMNTRLDAADHALDLVDQGHPREAMENLRPAAIRATLQQVRAAVQALQDAEEQKLLDRKNVTLARSKQFGWLVGGLIVAGVLVVAVLIYLLHWVYQLQRLVTMCAWTQQVEIDGKWVRFEEYLDRTFGLKVTHGISAEATKQVLADLQQRIKSGTL